MNYIEGGGDFTRDNPGGRNFTVRHSRTWDVRDSERHLVSRTVPRIGRDVSVFTDYCRAVHSAGCAVKAPEHLHFHSRFDRGW